MKTRLFLLMTLLMTSTQAFARSPIPFVNQGQDGFVLVLWSDYTDAAIQSMLARIKETGAKTITLPVFGCQTSITSADVGACSVVQGQFSDPAVGRAVAAQRTTALHIAQLVVAAGFQAVFLPIVVTPQWDWRGEFQPTDVNGWFQTYEAWLKGVAAEANSLGMKEFIAGSEFSKLYAYSSNWTTLLSDMHSVFQGPLIVTVNWGELDYGFWDQADAIGVSEYYPLATSTSATQDDLNQGALTVKNTIVSAAKKYGRPVYLTEVGFPSTVNAAIQPWQQTNTDASDFNLQSECFQAFSNAWASESTLARMAVWATGDLTDPEYAESFEILGKPAESVMKNFFTAREAHF